MREILRAAGFADVAFADVHEPVYYGPDVAAALAWVRGFTCTSEALKRLDPAEAARAVGRLSEVFAAHLTDDGIWFDSARLDRHRAPGLGAVTRSIRSTNQSCHSWLVQPCWVVSLR